MKKVHLIFLSVFILASLMVQGQKYQISSTADDAEESVAFTTVNLFSPVIDLTGDPTDARSRKQIIGLRFNNVRLERGAPLSSCHLAFHVAQASTKFSMLSIRGEKKANPEPFQAVNRNLSSRIKTTARANWNKVENWTEVGKVMKSPDISNVLMEIINQNDWQSGNSIVLFIEGNGERHAVSYDKNPEQAIQLLLNGASPSISRPAPSPVAQKPRPTPQPKAKPQAPVQTDECNIPEPPVGVARTLYLQGNISMEKEDFKYAESRYSYALDNLKHAKFYIARAAARHLLDRYDEAQDDLKKAAATGIAMNVAEKCFKDLVSLYKNFENTGETFETCFSKNMRGFKLPECPIRISVGDGLATLFMNSKYEHTVQKNDHYVDFYYHMYTTAYEWVIRPGEFHDCNPNISTKFKPKNVNVNLTAKTAGWFEIPVTLKYVTTYFGKDDAQKVGKPKTEEWFLVGWLLKIHTGETTVVGRIYGAEGHVSSGINIGD